jgi:diadenosine tetraphosphate (Ap4A) HIT family hydrolase
VPRRVPRQSAVDAVTRDTPAGACPMCRVATGDRALAQNEAALVVTNRYPLRWGHLLVVARRHVTSFSTLTDREHALLSELTLRAARALERTLSPARVFVASLGSSSEGLLLTTPHLHTHVLPVSEADARPADVFTWANGVLEADPEEWAELDASLAPWLA